MIVATTTGAAIAFIFLISRITDFGLEAASRPQGSYVLYISKMIVQCDMKHLIPYKELAVIQTVVKKMCDHK